MGGKIEHIADIYGYDELLAWLIENGSDYTP